MSVNLSVLVNGRPIKTYSHESKTFVEGREGSDFTLRIQNTAFSRVLAIVSVDGLSIMDGKPAGNDSGGYVLSALETIDIPGWKLDANAVAKFVFMEKKASYSAESGQGTRNVGVIGVKSFSEKIYYQYRQSYDCWNNGAFALGAGEPFFGCSLADSAISKSAMCGFGATAANAVGQNSAEVMSLNSIGTGFGQETEFKTTTVSFEKCYALPDVVIYYDSRKNLEQRGIVIRTKKEKVFVEPNPFPAIGCKPPRLWRRRGQDGRY